MEDTLFRVGVAIILAIATAIPPTYIYWRHLRTKLDKELEYQDGGGI